MKEGNPSSYVYNIVDHCLSNEIGDFEKGLSRRA